jgi:hypothetical protein
VCIVKVINIYIVQQKIDIKHVCSSNPYNSSSALNMKCALLLLLVGASISTLEAYTVVHGVSWNRPAGDVWPQFDVEMCKRYCDDTAFSCRQHCPGTKKVSPEWFTCKKACQKARSRTCFPECYTHQARRG